MIDRLAKVSVLLLAVFAYKSLQSYTNRDTQNV